MRVPWTVRIVVLVLAAGALSACDAIAPTTPPPASDAPSSVRVAPPEPTPGVTSPEATATARTPTTEPTIAPTPEPLVLGGTWAEPKAGGTLTSYTTTLSARPTATGDGVTTFARRAMGPRGRDEAAVAHVVASMRRRYAEHWADTLPIGRVMVPEDAAAALMYLASPAASGVTGATLMVDGGQGMQCKLPAAEIERGR